jgi:hypothetical protein
LPFNTPIIKQIFLLTILFLPKVVPNTKKCDLAQKTDKMNLTRQEILFQNDNDFKNGAK